MNFAFFTNPRYSVQICTSTSCVSTRVSSPIRCRDRITFTRTSDTGTKMCGFFSDPCFTHQKSSTSCFLFVAISDVFLSPLSLSLSLTHIHTHSLTHTHTHFLSHTHSHAISLSLTHATYSPNVFNISKLFEHFPN